jgi:hypothetical protein
MESGLKCHLVTPHTVVIHMSIREREQVRGAAAGVKQNHSLEASVGSVSYPDHGSGIYSLTLDKQALPPLLSLKLFTPGLPVERK